MTGGAGTCSGGGEAGMAAFLAPSVGRQRSSRRRLEATDGTRAVGGEAVEGKLDVRRVKVVV